MGLMKTMAGRGRGPAGITSAGGAPGAATFSADTREWDALEKRLVRLKKATRNKIVRQSMRKATKPVLQAMKAEARTHVRKGRGHTRKKGVKSLMRIVAGKLKLRAMKRSRRRIGFRILIAARPAELQALRGLPPPRLPWYPPAHYGFGHKTRAGRKIPGSRWMRRVIERLESRWLRDFSRYAHDAIAGEMKKS